MSDASFAMNREEEEPEVFDLKFRSSQRQGRGGEKDNLIVRQRSLVTSETSQRRDSRSLKEKALKGSGGAGAARVSPAG